MCLEPCICFLGWDPYICALTTGRTLLLRTWEPLVERESPPPSHAVDPHRPQGSPAGPSFLQPRILPQAFLLQTCDALDLAQALSLSLCVADSRQITC